AKRGYLLTDDTRYLSPYERARRSLPGELQSLQQQTFANPGQRQRVESIQAIVTSTLDEIQQTIDLHRAGNTAAALAVIRTDQSRTAMERVGVLTDAVEADEQAML